MLDTAVPRPLSVSAASFVLVRTQINTDRRIRFQGANGLRVSVWLAGRLSFFTRSWPTDGVWGVGYMACSWPSTGRGLLYIRWTSGLGWTLRSEFSERFLSAWGKLSTDRRADGRAGWPLRSQQGPSHILLLGPLLRPFGLPPHSFCFFPEVPIRGHDCFLSISSIGEI